MRHHDWLPGGGERVMRGRRARKRNTVEFSNLGSLDEWMFDSREVPLVDELHALEGPDLVLHIEEEAEALAEAQTHQWEAEGEKRAREPKAKAEELRDAAEAQDKACDDQLEILNGAAETADAGLRALQPHITRPVRDGIRYIGTWIGLLLGDVASITMAAISLGERPELAACQGIAVALAALAVGTIADEIKGAREARRRKKDDLNEDEQKFATLFLGEDPGERIIKLMVVGGLGVILLIAGGIAALRSSIDGGLAGVVYGSLATVVAGGSWFNCYRHADEVKEKLDHVLKRHTTADAKYREISEGGPRAQCEAYLAEADSHKMECKARGQAAARFIRAQGKRFLSEHPEIAGHGRAARRGRAATPGKDKVISNGAGKVNKLRDESHETGVGGDGRDGGYL